MIRKVRNGVTSTVRTGLTYMGWSKQIGIDLGTQNTVVATPDGKVLANEPTLVCRNKKTDEMFYGNDAKKKQGFVSDQFEFFNPISDGTINPKNEDYVTGFIGHILGLARWSPKPDVVIAISCRLKEKDMRNVDLVARPLVNSLHYIFQPFGAAIAHGVDITKDGITTIVWDIGHGTSDGLAISTEDNVYFEGVPVGGSEMNEAIINYVKDKYSLQIDENIASDIKHSIGCAIVDEDEPFYRSLRSFLPDEDPQKKDYKKKVGFQDIPITDTEICKVLIPLLEQERDAMLAFLGELSKRNPSITTKITAVEKGSGREGAVAEQLVILLGGGGSLLRKIDAWMEENVRIKIELITDPLRAAAIGAAKCAADKKLMKKYEVRYTDVSERDVLLESSNRDVQDVINAQRALRVVQRQDPEGLRFVTRGKS